MAITNVHGWQNQNTAGTPNVLAFTANPGTNNTLFACFMIYSGGVAVTPPTVTDTIGNAWVQDNVVGDATNGQSFVFRCSNNTSNGTVPDSVTVASSGAASINLFISEFNVGGTPSLDKTAAQLVANSTAINSGPTATRSVASELLIGICHAGGPGNSVTSMTAGWTSQIGTTNSTAAEYLIVSAVGTDALTAVAAVAQNSLAIVCTYSVSATGITPPSQAVSAGFTRLDFNDEFDVAPDIGFNTRGHKWNAGLWWQNVPDTACFTQSGSVLTITDYKQIATTTNATFVVPGANTTVQVNTVAAHGLIVGDVVVITDGTHKLIGDVTIVNSTTQVTVNTRTWAGNVTGTMAVSVPVRKVSTGVDGVELCTQEKAHGTGSYWRGGYFEARMNMTDWSAMVLYASSKPAGPQMVLATLATTSTAITTTGNPGNAQSFSITISATSLISVGDLVKITNGANTNVFVVTAVTDSTHITVNSGVNSVNAVIGTGATIQRANSYSLFSEIDIIETDPNTPLKTVTTNHFNTASGTIVIADYQSFPNNNTSANSTVGQFNIFGCLWTQSTISWYFNNVLQTSFMAGTGAWQQHFLDLVAGAGGVNSGPGNNFSTVNPPTNQIDWVRVWQPPFPSPGGTITNIQPFIEAHASSSTVSKAFANNIAAGNKIFVCTFAKPPFAGPGGITDTLGNQYVLVPNTGGGGTGTPAIWYCDSIAGGACTVTATFAGGTYIALHIAEFNFSGGVVVIDQQTNVVDASASTSMTSGITNTRQVANELLIGLNIPLAGALATAGNATWTSRIASDSLSLSQYKIVSSVGTDASTATQSPSQSYTGLVATFYSTGSVVTNPSVPTGFSATVLSSSSIRLDWTASTGGTGGIHYVVQHKTGAASFTTITGGVTGVGVVTVTDTGLTANTLYLYQIQAVDSIGGTSAFASTSATTQTGGPPPPTIFTAADVTRAAVLAQITNATNSFNSGTLNNQVNIPSGNASGINAWSTAISITVPMTILGAGQGVTTIHNSSSGSSGLETPTFVASLTASGRFEISNMTLIADVGGTGNPPSSNGIQLVGNVEMKRYVIHDITFQNQDFGIYNGGSENSAFGLAYNCTFNNVRIPIRNSGFSNTASLHGLTVPSPAWGTDNYFVMEDCQINLGPAWNPSAQTSYLGDTESPMNYIVRHCTATINRNASVTPAVGVDEWDMHGDGFSNLNNFAFVIHDNVYTYTNTTTVNNSKLADIRGGVGALVYNNTYQQGPMGGYIQVHANRSTDGDSTFPANCWQWNNKNTAGALITDTSGTALQIGPPSGFTTPNGGESYQGNTLVYPHPLRSAPSLPTSPGFVQISENDLGSTASLSVTATFANPQNVGDCNLVAVAWHPGAASASVTDTAGNLYTASGPVVSVTDSGSVVRAQQIFSANNITAFAGQNVVTATLNSSSTNLTIRALEYFGISTTAPIDAISSSSGVNSATASSGSVVPTQSGDILVGFTYAGTTVQTITSGYTQRSTGFSLAEDVTAVGTGGTGVAGTTGTVRPALTGNLSDVISMYGQCSAGDTLQIPNGSFVWSDRLDVSKSLTIMGAGTTSGPNLTQISIATPLANLLTDPFQPGPQDIQLIRVSPPIGITPTGKPASTGPLPGDVFVTIHDIAFNMVNIPYYHHTGGYQLPDQSGIVVYGFSQNDYNNALTSNPALTQIHIYNCTFNAGKAQIHVYGKVYGCIDNCTFTNGDCGVMMWGCDSDAWTGTTYNTPGTQNAMFIENNTFILNNSLAWPGDAGFPSDPNGVAWAIDHQIYHQQGAKSVIRNNTLDSTAMTKTSSGNVVASNFFFDIHGNQVYYNTGSFNLRGNPLVEIYNNTVKAHTTFQFLEQRGGSCICYNNNFSCADGSIGKLNMWEEECWQTGFFNPLRTPAATGLTLAQLWPAEDMVNATFFFNNTFSNTGNTNTQMTLANGMIAVGDPGAPDGGAAERQMILENRDFWQTMPSSTTFVSGGYPAVREIDAGGRTGYPNNYRSITSYAQFQYPHPFVASESSPAGFSASVTLSSSVGWVMHLVALKTTAIGTPPTTPTGFSATATSTTGPNAATNRITWTTSTDQGTGQTGNTTAQLVYPIEHQTGAGSFTEFTPGLGAPGVTAPATIITFDDTGLTANTQYNYRLRSRDTAGLTSPYTTPNFSALTLPVDTQGPTAPTGVSATAVSSSQINLAWTGASDLTNPEIQLTYFIERAPASLVFALIGTSGPNAIPPHVFQDTGLTPSTQYFYRIYAKDPSGNPGPNSSPNATDITSAPPTLSLAQHRASLNTVTGTTMALAFSSTQTAGNGNIVTIAFPNSVTATVADSNGAYTVAKTVNDATQAYVISVYYRTGINAGANTVTATFSASVSSGAANIHISEWQGMATASPVDGTVSATGAGTPINTSEVVSSGNLTTTNANDLLYGAGLPGQSFTSPGSGYTQLDIDTNGVMSEYQIVSAVGAYSSTGTITQGGPFTMILAAFKAAPPPAQTINLTGAGIISREVFGGTTVQISLPPINLSGLVSKEAFGALTVIPGNVNLNLGGIVSAQTFGNTTVIPGNVNLSPQGMASAEAFGALRVDNPQNVLLTGRAIPSAEAFGAPHFDNPATVTLFGISSAEAVVGPRVDVVGALTINLNGSGIPSAQAIGLQVIQPINANINLGGIVGAEQFGTQTFNVPPSRSVNLIGSGIPSAEAFGIPLVGLAGSQNVFLGGILSAESFGPVNVAHAGPQSVNLSGAGIQSAETFGSLIVFQPSDQGPATMSRVL